MNTKTDPRIQYTSWLANETAYYLRKSETEKNDAIRHMAIGRLSALQDAQTKFTDVFGTPAVGGDAA